MIAMTIFAVVALALGKTIIQTRKLADTSIHNTIAYGYAEQIMAMDYEDLLNSVNDPTSTPLTLKAVTPSSTSSLEVDDLLYLNTVNNKDILIDILESNGSERSIYMPMNFTLTATNLDIGANPYKAVQIQIFYNYESPSKRYDRWVNDSIHFVKSAVQIY